MTTGKVYTRTGDKGKTSLIGGTRVSKAHLRLDAYGTFDELNSVIGLMRFHMKSEIDTAENAKLQSVCEDIQNDLFNLGSHLACEDVKLRASLPSVTQVHIDELEKMMDEYSAKLAPLKNFVLPGGSGAASTAHIARTVCRRAERLCVALQNSEIVSREDATARSQEGEVSANEVEEDVVKYINRLSDYLFVLSRYLNHLSGNPEVLWAPRKK